MTPGEGLTLWAPAKINLFLKVLGARGDGFHEIETIFQAVDLHDLVRLALTTTGAVEVEVTGADVGPAKANLAYRAASALAKAAGTRLGVHVHLEKRIPAGAGLGGGSSDAAAVLRGLNGILGAPLSPQELADIAIDLGSDVPFFLGERTLALGRGRGERLERLPPLPEAHLALVLPPVHVSTAWAYRELDARRATGGEGPFLEVGTDGPVDWAEVAAFAANDFEDVVAAAHPEVAESLRVLREAGAAPAMLSGSGAACFGVFADADAAAEAIRMMSQRVTWPIRAARTLTAWPGLAGALST
ncbi:MAG: 4-(cytidine 5'-diphospho)-2-C-methyl-D-erythritol kinase [Gemmatimonadetes bacterium]|nr:4-(cytidine 5'-diphospho)-2-C-methyl-D-erythritol kinase [Gemmatimonadota bacterium]